jgi:hypothetical protein
LRLLRLVLILFLLYLPILGIFSTIFGQRGAAVGLFFFVPLIIFVFTLGDRVLMNIVNGRKLPYSGNQKIYYILGKLAFSMDMREPKIVIYKRGRPTAHSIKTWVYRNGIILIHADLINRLTLPEIQSVLSFEMLRLKSHFSLSLLIYNYFSIITKRAMLPIKKALNTNRLSWIILFTGFVTTPFWEIIKILAFNPKSTLSLDKQTASFLGDSSQLKSSLSKIYSLEGNSNIWEDYTFYGSIIEKSRSGQLVELFESRKVFERRIANL